MVDAAASLGNCGLLTSWLGDEKAVVFSLHATKVLAAGEGGLVVALDHDWAGEIRRWINFGFDANRVASIVGANAKMSEYSAAVALASLDGIEDEKSDWESAKKSAEGVGLPASMKLPPWGVGAFDPYWLVRFENKEAMEAVRGHMKNGGIETRVWWSRSCHQMEAFSNQDHTEVVYSDSLVDTVLGLPMFRGMRPQEFARIESALATCIGASG